MVEITKWHIPKRINNPMTLRNPVGIILHYIGNPGTSAKANANYLHNVNEQKSVNYIVDDTSIYELIPPEFKSYGTSNGAYNNGYIQIEMCHPDATGRITEATLNNTIELCRALIKKYGLTKVIRHYDVTGKKCPLYYVNNPTEWNLLQGRILKGDDVMDTTPSDFTVSTAIKHLANKGVISSPEYWEKAAGVVKYLDELLINVAKKI